MSKEDLEPEEHDVELLVDTLRKSFGAEKSRYFVDERNNLFVEIEGLQHLSDEEITEVAAPVLDELDMGFDEILLLPLN